jgi:hypothetical protein
LTIAAAATAKDAGRPQPSWRASKKLRPLNKESPAAATTSMARTLIPVTCQIVAETSEKPDCFMASGTGKVSYRGACIGYMALLM